MGGFIVTAVIGLVAIVIGIVNMSGNVSSIHSYHRERVSEEDRIPFGRLVGLGTIVIGFSLIVYSGLSALAVYTSNTVLTVVSTVLLIIGIVAGMALSFYAMKKYNGGIF